MKRIFELVLSLLLVSCTGTQITAAPAVTRTREFPTATSLPRTLVPSLTPVPKISCDPLKAEFCITEGHFLLQRPIHTPANPAVDPTYRYGSTANGTREPHHGVEFPNPSGTPVYAAAEGTVIFAGPDVRALYSPWPDFYGNLVVLRHAQGLFTLYAHLSKIDVEENQVVSAGTQVGEVGRTGVAIGSHLHFEVRRGAPEDYYATQNPELWLIPDRDAGGNLLGAMMISVMDENRSLLKYAKFTIRYDPSRSGRPVRSYYGETYPSDLLTGEENAGLGDLLPGQYRIAIERNGKVYERWVEVESDKLTQVAFVVR